MTKKLYRRESYKTKEEWLNARGIGGSSAAAVLGKSKWLTPNDLYNELALGKRKIIPENERMIAGTKSENAIRTIFTLIYHDRFKVTNPPKKTFWLFRRIDKPYLTITPDGLALELDTGKKFGVEIKNVQMIKREVKDLWENDTLPDQYFCQCLHYFIGKPDLDGVILFALLEYQKFDEETEKWVFSHIVIRPYVICREDVISQIAYLENKETEFYENNIKVKKRPCLKLSFTK